MSDTPDWEAWQRVLGGLSRLSRDVPEPSTIFAERTLITRMLLRIEDMRSMIRGFQTIGGTVQMLGLHEEEDADGNGE